jgi:hypothetical protein
VTGESEGEILEGVWRFEAIHPEWTEWEGGEEGWEPLVGWWAVSADGGLVLIDPLIFDWPAVDQLVEAQGGCAGIVRTCHWHQRSIAVAAARYGAEIWAKPYRDGSVGRPLDHEVRDGEELFGKAVAYEMERDDEIALWLTEQATMIFGDAMVRTAEGQLQVCPESWTQPAGGYVRLLSLLRGLRDLPVEHVLVSHGPLVLGDGLAALRAATG